MTNFQTKKEKRTFHAKKQAGAELKKKEKEFFGSKTGEKCGNKVQKLTDFKEKKNISCQKNKLGLSLRRKNDSQGNKKIVIPKGIKQVLFPRPFLNM